jgi:hypothetical protein
MCLKRILKNKKKGLPKEFTAYKAVIEYKKGHFKPPIFRAIEIKKENHLDVVATTVRPPEGGRYKPYFHSFRSIGACRAVEKSEPSKYVFIKIRIKKKDVTCVGEVGGRNGPDYQTIVSKAYTTEFEKAKL